MVVVAWSSKSSRDPDKGDEERGEHLVVIFRELAFDVNSYCGLRGTGINRDKNEIVNECWSL